MSPTSKEAPKRTLPAGHPQAGYVSPDLSFQDSTGVLPDEEQEFHDERDEAREEEAKAVAEAEDKAATAEAEESAKAEARQEAATKKQAESKAAAPRANPA